MAEVEWGCQVAMACRKQVQVTWQGKLTRLGPATPTGGPTPGLIRLDTIVRAAPFRLARSAARRSRRSPSSVDYAVAIDIAGVQRWSVFLKDGGGRYVGDREGRITRAG